MEHLGVYKSLLKCVCAYFQIELEFGSLGF